jgi:hypothetical protein
MIASARCAQGIGSAMRFQETTLGRLGKLLHLQMEDITEEPLPRRWVELILYLEEEERTRQPEPEPERPLL